MRRILILVSPKGKYFLMNGSKNEGEWKNDKQHGQGLNEIKGRCFGKMGKLKKVNGKTTNSQLVAESLETKKGINSFFKLFSKN